MPDITDYGALRDGTLCHGAIQAALDATAAAGGGVVRVPAGTFTAGAIRLRDGVLLELSAGAVLLAAAGDEAFTATGRVHDGGRNLRWITGAGVRGAGIVGPGEIRGRGDAPLAHGQQEGSPFRLASLVIEDAQDLRLEGFTLRHSEHWGIHLLGCERVTVRGLTIRSRIDRINTDGIDPDGCRDVVISDCHIESGDDCLCFKATTVRALERVVVRNCTLRTWCTAIKFGTESVGDMRDIVVSGCVAEAPNGIGVFKKDAGAIERVIIGDCVLRSFPHPQWNVEWPVSIDIERRWWDKPVGPVRDLRLHDLLIEASSGILVQGMPEMPVEGLVVRDVALRAPRSLSYAQRSKPVGGKRQGDDGRDRPFARMPAWFAAAHCRGLRVDGFTAQVGAEVDAEGRARAPLLTHDCPDARVDGTPAPVGAPVF